MKQLLITIAAVVLVGCGNPEADRTLSFAVEKGDIKAALKANYDGANLNKERNGTTLLHYASRYSSKELIELLIDNGADVNARNKEQSTPLLGAVAEGRMNIVELLVNKGADVSAKYKRGRTALHDAAAYGHKGICEILIAEGVNINEGSWDGTTSLHNAAQNGNKDVVEILIAEGANLNVRTNKNRTPLDCVNGESEIADLLRKHGGETAEELKAEGK